MIHEYKMIHEYNNSSILRNYPMKMSYISYPSRYTKGDFDLYDQKNKVGERLKYFLLFKGYNYKTGKKIKNKEEYKMLEADFLIRGEPFTIMDKIDRKFYLKVSVSILIEIDRLNKNIARYNAKVDEVIDKIDQLKKWDDFVEFDGKLYGIPYTIHTEMSCGGEMFLNQVGTQDGMNLFVYECEKCGYRD